MGKVLKRAASIALAAVIITLSVLGLEIKAAGNDVVVHVQDGTGWGSINIYNWGDKGETAGPWPGAVMEKDKVDGWFVYTISTECDLNLVFSKNGTPQSGDVKGISKDRKEIWIVIGGEGEANDMGAATNQAVLYTEPEDGWPINLQTVDDTTAAEGMKDETPKTGDNLATAPIVFIGIVAFITGMVFLLKKRLVKE